MSVLENFSIKSKLMVSLLLIALTTTITGLLGIYYTTVVGGMGEDVGAKYAPLGDAAMEIKLTATTAHLWFEEIVAGDSSEDIEHVWELLDESLWYCNVIIKGGANDEGTFYPVNDPAITNEVKEVERSIERFRAIAQQRYADKDNASTIGSGIDQSFDNTYESIQSDLEAVISLYANRVSVVGQLAEAKYLLANGHLFFEELLAGDEEVKLKDVLNNFKDAHSNIETIQSEIGGKQMKYLSRNVAEFIEIAQERYDRNVKNATRSAEADLIFDREFSNFMSRADDAEEMIHHYMDHGLESLNRKHIQSIVVMILVSILGIALAVFISYVITNDISRTIGGSMKKIVEVVTKVSEGNLTVKFDQYEKKEGLMKLMEDMVLRLKQVVITVTEGASNIASASQQVSSSSQVLSQGATQQAASVEEVSASMEEITANIQQNTDNANLTEKISSDATKGIDDIAAASKESLESVLKISEKISVIGDIAEVTDLLAINAAIEAARAGEFGKGFAIVASEVRKLAERSQQAANEIIALSENSVRLTERSRDILEEVIPNVRKTGNLVKEIACASTEQYAGTGQINSAVQQLNQVTQHTASTAEEMSASASELSSQAKGLRDVVSFFKIDITDKVHKTRSVPEYKNSKVVKDEIIDNDVKTVNQEISGITLDMSDSDNSDQQFEKY